MSTVRRQARAAIVAGVFAVLAFGAARGGEGGFRVADGFEVTLFAGDDLAHDIFSMTHDARGRVVVAGRGYVKTLHDRDGDGRADDAVLFADRPQEGARGLFFAGDDLLCSGDKGLWLLRDRDGDGRAEVPGERWLESTASGGEHAANGIVKGPDGWFYWITGNDGGITRAHATLPGSPVLDPVCGVLVRVAPDGRASEILSHGFRNPYDLDFNAFGNIFTYEADGERDQHLPWYSPTRVFDVALGMHHGWVIKGWQHAWNRPAAIPDGVERLAEVGRGSPTGVVTYRHRRFPARYRGGLFALCWSLGRVYFLPLERRGSTYATRLEVFMEAEPGVGFAPVDASVGPEGDLFVAIGGRGTRGSVFRVRYSGAVVDDVPRDAVRGVLAADQPLASWSRARWEPEAKGLGMSAFASAALDAALPRLERLRAVEILVDLFGGLPAGVGHDLARDDDLEVAARAVWALARGPGDSRSERILADLAGRAEPRLARAAWEAALVWPPPPAAAAAGLDWYAGFAHGDRRVRAAAVLAARRRLPSRAALGEAPVSVDPRHTIGALLAFGPGREDSAAAEREAAMKAAAAALAQTEDPRVRLDAVRVLQLALGDVLLVQDQLQVSDGFVGRHAVTVDAEVRRRVHGVALAPFPTGGTDLDRELARLLSMLAIESTDALERVGRLWTETSAAEDDLHFLLAAAHMAGKRSADFTRRSAAALAGLHHKMRNLRKEPSRFWPVRVRAIFGNLRRHDGALVEALLASPAFCLAGQAIFVEELTGEERVAAARRLVTRVEAVRVEAVRVAESAGEGNGVAWTAELVAIAAELPREEGLPRLRCLWDDPVLRDAVTLAIAKAADPEDRDRLVEALASRQAGVAPAAAAALIRIGGAASADEIRAAVESLGRLSGAKDDVAPRRQLCDLLERWSGMAVDSGEGGGPRAAYEVWLAWLRRTHAAAAAEIDAAAASSAGGWERRLAGVDWDSGDAMRGERIFRSRGCHGCHAGATRLGPDLKGVGARLSRADLFTAIVDPSRDVSPAYAAKEIVTRSGAVVSGVLIYDSPEVNLVQTSADTTVRVAGADVVDVRPSATSFMPAGLVDGLGDADLSDLYACLRRL